jgi:hypothetical protein
MRLRDSGSVLTSVRAIDLCPGGRRGLEQVSENRLEA